MSHYDIVRDCRVDGIFHIDVGQSRHHLRIVVTMREPPPSKRKAVDGDACDDDGDDDRVDDDDDDEAEEMEDEIAGDVDKTGVKKRKRAARVPKARGTITVRDRLPLIHTGADMRLVVRPTLNAEGQPDVVAGTYELIEVLRYRPLAQLKYAAVSGALRDAGQMVLRRTTRIEQHRSLADANLIAFNSASTQSGIRDTSDVLVPKPVRAALLALGFEFQYPTFLATLQSAFKTGAEQRCQRALHTGLRGYYALQSPLLTNLGNAGSAEVVLAVGARRSVLRPHVLAHALNLLVLPPHNARASLLEQMTVAQLLACAAQRNYVDTMFRLPECDYQRAGSIARRVCCDDIVLHRWRRAAPDQPEMQNAKALTQVMSHLPMGASLEFLWASVDWYQRLPTRYGTTMFECGEPREIVEAAYAAWERSVRAQAQLKRPKKAAKKAAPPVALAAVDDDEHSEELWLPADTPAWAVANEALAAANDDVESEESELDMDAPPTTALGAGGAGVCRTQWLRSQLSLIEPAPTECWVKNATTPLFMTVKAAKVARQIVDAVRALGERLALYVVHSSGFGTGGVDDAVFTERIVHTADVRAARVAANGRLPLVTLVFRSFAARDKYRVWIAEHRPANRFTLATLTLEEVISDSTLFAGVRLQLAHATRLVVIDAHLLCEHDMANVLGTFVARNLVNGHLALCGEVDALAPEPHCESGAPFFDMWRAQALRTVDLDGGSCVRGYATSRGPRPETDALSSIAVRHALALKLTRNPITRARDIAKCLLGNACTVQITGYGRRAFEAGCHTLADFLSRHLQKTDVQRELKGEKLNRARAVQETLLAWSKEPWRAESTVITSLPFIKYRTLIVRFDGAFVCDAACRRAERLRTRNLRHVFAHEPLLSLDTLDLYLKLDRVSADLMDVDHRNCCFTDDPLMLSVMRHRHELRSASVMMARDCARGVDVNTSRVCMLLRPMAGGLSYGDELDAEQLLASPLRCTDTVQLILPHATEDQVKTTAAQLVKPLGFYHRPPPTTLCTMIELALKQCATQQRGESMSSGGGTDVCWDDNIDSLLAD